MIYNPKPLDLNKVELPKEYGVIEEKIAESVHDSWAYQRLKEGWRYGDHYDGEKKLHPDLVPYDCLPESEKKYDRNTAKTTLMMIEELGYKIVKK